MSENNALENKLDRYLHPVSPERDFIERLRYRLLVKPEITIEYPNYLYMILFICFNFLFGVGLIWLLGRIFRDRDKK